MGHMDNRAYWQWEHTGQQGTGGMGHMGNGVPPRVNINLLQSSFRVLG